MPFSILLTSSGGLSIDLSQDFAGTYHSLPFKGGCEPQCLAPVDGLIHNLLLWLHSTSNFASATLLRMAMRFAVWTFCFCGGAKSSKPYLSGPVALLKCLGPSSSSFRALVNVLQGGPANRAVSALLQLLPHFQPDVIGRQVLILTID